MCVPDAIMPEFKRLQRGPVLHVVSRAEGVLDIVQELRDTAQTVSAAAYR